MSKLSKILDFFRPKLSEKERLEIRALRDEHPVKMEDGCYYADPAAVQAALNNFHEKRKLSDEERLANRVQIRDDIERRRAKTQSFSGRIFVNPEMLYMDSAQQAKIRSDLQTLVDQSSVQIDEGAVCNANSEAAQSSLTDAPKTQKIKI